MDNEQKNLSTLSSSVELSNAMSSGVALESPINECSMASEQSSTGSSHELSRSRDGLTHTSGQNMVIESSFANQVADQHVNEHNMANQCEIPQARFLDTALTHHIDSPFAEHLQASNGPDVSSVQTPTYNPAASPFVSGNTNDHDFTPGHDPVTHSPSEYPIEQPIGPVQLIQNSSQHYSPQEPHHDATLSNSPNLSVLNVNNPLTDPGSHHFSTPPTRITSPIRHSRRQSTVAQYSSPGRALHHPINPLETPERRNDCLRGRLSELEQMRREVLIVYCEMGVVLGGYVSMLYLAWRTFDANEHLPELYEAQSQVQLALDERDRYGRTWKWIGDEIEELLADLLFPEDAETN